MLKIQPCRTAVLRSAAALTGVLILGAGADARRPEGRQDARSVHITAAGSPAIPAADTVRSLTVKAQISNAVVGAYNGVYTSQAQAILCGAESYTMPWRTNAFAVEFPDDDPDRYEVRSLTFDADTLAAGTTTTRFHLNVGINSPTAGKPPLFVVRTKTTTFNEHGTAILTISGGVRRLVVHGVNDMLTIDLDITCR